MSRLYKIRIETTRLKGLENRLEGLQNDYEGLSKQIGHTSNASDRSNLERQLTAINEGMERVAQECEQLEQTIQQLQSYKGVDALPEELQSLVNVLTYVAFETLTQAYRECLAGGRPRPVPETLEALLGQLAEMPGEPDEVKPLLRFVIRLIQEQSLDATQQRALRQWAQAQGLPPVTSVSVLSQKRPKTMEICLMVKVQPRSLNDFSLGYLVSAAIVKDPNPLKPESERIEIRLNIPEGTNSKCAPGYAEDELPSVLSELINFCGGEYGIALTDLTVQCFLPLELMSLPIEHWRIRMGRSQEPCSGQRCKAIVVRSYDRHFSPDYRAAAGEWKKYWTRLLDCLESNCTETLAGLDPTAGKITIDHNHQRLVGCKFIEHGDRQKQADFWDHFLGQGLPVALWIRQIGLAPQAGETIMSEITQSCVAELPLSLAQQRFKALSEESETDRLRAAPLCLLWDNPFRPFPTLDYQSEYQNS